MEEVLRLERTPIAWGRDRILLITVNDEVGTARMSLHRLGLEVALMVAFVQRPGIAHLLQQSLGDIGCVQTLIELQGYLHSQAHSHPRVDCVLVIGLVREPHDTLLVDQIVGMLACDRPHWNVQVMTVMASVSHDVCVWSLARSWRSPPSETTTCEVKLEIPSATTITREKVENLEELLGLHRHATGGLLPGHLQRQLHEEWLQAR
eukprot:1054168-Amphidinium_carterae.1